MHAVYCFLSNSDNPYGEFEDNVNSEYYDFDENNWYQGMCEVRKNGDVLSLCSDSDWRGRNELYNKFFRMPASERWEEALKFAFACLTNDIETAYIAGDWEHKEKYNDITLVNAPEKLRHRLREVAKNADRFTLASLTEAIATAEGYNKYGLGSEFSSPYTSPRFVAVGEAKLDDEDVSILFVDIHT